MRTSKETIRTAREFVVLASGCPSPVAAPWSDSAVLPRPRLELAAAGTGVVDIAARGYGEVVGGAIKASETGGRAVPSIPSALAAAALKHTTGTAKQDQQYLMNRRDHRTWRPPA
jgi:hypothetical protein